VVAAGGCREQEETLGKEQEDGWHPEGNSCRAHYTLDTCAHFSNVISHAPPRVCYPCRASRVLSLSIAIAIASKKGEERKQDERSKDEGTAQGFVLLIIRPSDMQFSSGVE